MNVIYLLIRSSWRLVAIAVFTGLLSGACSARLIATINSTVSGDRTQIWSFAALALVVLVAGIISQLLLIRLSQGVIFDLQIRLSRRILSASLRHLEQLGAPRLLATLTEDVQALSNTVFVIPFLCIDFAIVVGCAIYLGWLDWVALLLMLIFIFAAIVSVKFLLKKATYFFTLAREEQDRLFKQFRAITEGIKELKLNQQRRQAFLTNELQPAAGTVRDYKVVSLTILSVASNGGQILFFIAIGLLLFVIPRLTAVSNPVLSGYILTLTYLMGPVKNIMDMLPNLSRASVALRKIETLGLSLAAESESISESIVQNDLNQSWQHLELVGVTHAYRGGEKEEHNFIFGPIDLAFQPGELVFLVGGNGSGKSTLAKLITGLYIPEEGEIRIDGKPITNHNREWYRQLFSVIFYDFYLFDTLLGLSNTELEIQVIDYLKKLQIDHKVQVKDGVLSTTALSQGQRKRLALLTAYLEDRPIYLFDEWASDQDPVFKEIFYTQLLPELKNRGKTVLVISHDDRYFYQGDRIIKLDYGKLQYDKHLH
ncbi:cyclic peptide export ABC transporter [Aerosakkonema funiforme]|uniref:Cyclic peptide export ABC transporter n=1 Tax=Aerosakkonema funiforme FACHB-1375 TaxID=2949571 RepID=A0A926ZFQ0_9CYAN|nr:cyclic peptide export ABC transporter [Aerosakkonema funiforme]MBD2180909.1 cyclic peptide export ABC transporter [Aerosakkonema funiforme FACHB-1375]